MSTITTTIPALPSHMPEHLVARRTAQRQEVWTQIIALLIAVFSILLASTFVGRINEIRKDRQLVIDPRSIGGLPPDIALLGKLGTFRALAIDWAFIRADRLKEEGKHYEAYQLHETICRLAPRFPKVWVHAAWNMAYNISVTQYTPEARWQWVQNGIKVLRNEGIQYNPKAVSLYKELAWIYWHKIGDFLDDEHLNYKKALATEMERVLGPPPVTLSDQEYFDWFKQIVNAPRDLDQLIKTDADIARLVSKLRDLKLKPDDSLLEFVARHVRPELRLKDVLKDPSPDDTLFEQQLRVLRDPGLAPTVDRLLAAMRSKVLRERYKFDLDFMYKLMVEQYGPLDWRNAFAHALYWSSVGDELARGHVNLDVSDKLNNARFIFFALQNLIMRGHIVLIPNFDDPFSSYFEMLPDTRLIPYLHDTYMRLGKEHYGDDPRFVEGTPGPNYFNGFVTAMHNWIEILFLEGGDRNLKLAEEYFAWLREHNPHPDGTVQEMYLISIDEFVMNDILAQMSTYRAANAILRSFIERALKQFSLGDFNGGVTSLTRGRFCYEYWMVDTKKDPNERRKMQPFDILVRDQLEGYMKKPEVEPLWKARLWKGMPLLLKREVYDRLLPYFTDICASLDPPWALERAFPEPARMEDYRKAPPEDVIGKRREDVDQGAQYNR